MLGRVWCSDFAQPIAVFPNPTQGQLNIDLGAEHLGIRVTVTDAVGKVVATHAPGTQSQFALDLPAPAGYYVLQLETSSGRSATLKVLKQ